MAEHSQADEAIQDWHATVRRAIQSQFVEYGMPDFVDRDREDIIRRAQAEFCAEYASKNHADRASAVKRLAEASVDSWFRIQQGRRSIVNYTRIVDALSWSASAGIDVVDVSGAATFFRNWLEDSSFRRIMHSFSRFGDAFRKRHNSANIAGRRTFIIYSNLLTVDMIENFRHVLMQNLAIGFRPVVILDLISKLPEELASDMGCIAGEVCFDFGQFLSLESRHDDLPLFIGKQVEARHHLHDPMAWRKVCERVKATCEWRDAQALSCNEEISEFTHFLLQRHLKSRTCECREGPSRSAFHRGTLQTIEQPKPPPRLFFSGSRPASTKAVDMPHELHSPAKLRLLDDAGIGTERFLSLPPMAKLAFAARLARRIQPLIRIGWPGIPSERADRIESAIRVAEDLAAGAKPLLTPAPERATAVVAHLWSDQTTVGTGVYAALQAAADTAYAANFAAADDATNLTRRVLTVIKSVLMAADVAGIQRLVVAGIQRDFELLYQADEEGCWDASTRIQSTFFGALWPLGAPPGWIAPDRQVAPRDAGQGLRPWLAAPVMAFIPGLPSDLHFIQSMDSADARHIARALTAIDSMGPNGIQAIPFVVRSMASSDASVRLTALKVLRVICPSVDNYREAVDACWAAIEEEHTDELANEFRLDAIVRFCESVPALRAHLDVFRMPAMQGQDVPTSEHDTTANIPIPPEADASVMSDLAIIKANLRKSLAESGRTQEEIGVSMGYQGAVARATVSYILSPKSNPTLKTLLELARAMGRSLKDVI